MSSKSIKVVVVGDFGVGKTSLLVAYSGKASEDDSYNIPVNTKGKSYNLNMWDSLSGDNFSLNRSLVYLSAGERKADVILMLYSSVEPGSYQKLRDYWYPEVTQHCPTTPIVLVATKVDLLQDQATLQQLAHRGQAPVPHNQGVDLAKEIGAVKFFECSVISRQGLDACLNACIKVSSKNLSAQENGCTIS